MPQPVTIIFTAEEVDTLKHALNVACIYFGQRARTHNDTIVREANNDWSFEAGQLWSRVYRAEQAAKIDAPSEHLVLCDNCQSEGRVLTSNGGPDDEDHGTCPECEGNGQLLVEGQPVEMDDLDDMSGEA